MIKQLRQQFIWYTMGILLLFFVVIMCLLNVLFNVLGYHQNISLLRQLTLVPWAEAPVLSEDLEANHPARDVLNNKMDISPIYIANITPDGTVGNWMTLNGDMEPSQALVETIETALLSNTDQAQRVGNYLYAVGEQPGGIYVAVMDTANSVESAMIQRLYLLSLLICLVCLILLYPICYYLSRWVTRPTEKAFVQQKQFVSDAGHELKTPLSIISINANVLQSQMGHSKHMDYIQSEIKRMHHLISQLLTLARMEGNPMEQMKTSFSLSDAIFQVALPFESIAFEKRIAFDMDIDEEITTLGHQEQIAQVAIILLDNAFKYTKDTVRISLKKQGKHKVLEVYNNGAPINQEDLPHIFQRFYRCDKSRTSAQGYGLGLSIAKTIVDAHHGTISVHSADTQGVCFRVVL